MRKIIEGDVDLSGLLLTELLDLSDVAMNGYFFCSNNYLTNLVGSPHTVKGSFFCRNNLLDSLEGAPKEVKGCFSCEGNTLTSLKGIPKTIIDHFTIDRSLKDRFPEEYIRSLSEIGGMVCYVYGNV